PLESPEAVIITTFLNGEGLRPKEDIPDFENYYAELPLDIVDQFGMTPEVTEGTFGPYKDSTVVLLLTQLVHPKSRGTVRLNSKDPYDPPLIDPNYYEDSQDLKDIRLKDSLRIHERKVLVKMY
ncbi:hypothetical protein JTE90_008258, partial [Oedothorax gibbosus]